MEKRRNIRHTTQKKAEKIKKMIADGCKMSEVITEHWKGNIDKKNQWLHDYKELLTEEELAFLEYNYSLFDDEENKKESVADKTIEERVEELEKIVKSMQEIINPSSSTDTKEELIIPAEYGHMENYTRTVRLNKKFYNEFKKICDSNNIKLQDCLNFMFAEFVKKYK